MPDGGLLHLRDTDPIETARAPRYVGDELTNTKITMALRHGAPPVLLGARTIEVRG
jgi:hypothetical protein